MKTSYRFLPVPPLHTINHPHLRLVNDSPVLINNFFFARRPWFFFPARRFLRVFPLLCVNSLAVFSISHYLMQCLVFDNSAKSSTKKAKAQPKNCLPNSISYRRSCSHFNYYLIPGEEHVATRTISLPQRRLHAPVTRCPLRTKPTYTHKNRE